MLGLAPLASVPLASLRSVNYKLAGSFGTLAVTGIVAKTVKGYSVTGVGTLTLAGATVSTSVKRKLINAPGALALTGSDSSLASKFRRKLSIAAGALTLTGVVGGLAPRWRRAVSVSSGALLSSGTIGTLTIRRHRKQIGDAGAFVFTNSAPLPILTRGPARSLTLGLAPGASAWGGSMPPPTLTRGPARSLTLPCAFGAYVESTVAAFLKTRREILLVDGSFTESSATATPRVDRKISTSAETYYVIETGVNYLVRNGIHVVLVDPLAFTLDGSRVSPNVCRNSIVETGALFLAGAPTNLNVKRRVVSASGALALIGMTAASPADRHISITAGAVVSAGAVETLKTTRAVSSQPGIFLETGLPLSPTKAVHNSLAVNSGSFALDGVMGSDRRHHGFACDAGDYLDTGADAAPVMNCRLVSETGELSLNASDSLATTQRLLSLSRGDYLEKGGIFLRCYPFVAMSGNFSLSGDNARMKHQTFVGVPSWHGTSTVTPLEVTTSVGGQSMKTTVG